MSSRYHHGDLRAELLAAAAEEIAASGTAAVSLRNLARKVGVSHAAPAHHFGDKRGLFTALAAEGFRILHGRTSASIESSTALVDTGICYVEFALDHPAHFQVMWDAALIDPADPELVRERTTAFVVLYEALRRGTGAEREADLVAQGTAAWVIVHGAATLWLSGSLPYERDSGLVATVLEELAPGLLPVAKVSFEQFADRRSGSRR